MPAENLFAFVLMPFEQAFDDRYRLGIKETAAQLGILAERVDEQIYREGILERIYRQIDAADIVIADMSGKNPNVFYEVGYAHAKGKLCILLTTNADDIPFDLKHRRHVVYNGVITTLRDRLSEELKWAKTEVENVRNSRISVKAHATGGSIKKTAYLASGDINFTVDLTNNSKLASPEIEGLYFYATRKWRITQDGKSSAYTESDVPLFDRRHFLSSPVRRLSSGAWCQLQFQAEATLAHSTRGEEFKDSYRISGRSLLRIVTSEGQFDHEIQIDTSIDDIPF